jgi:peptidoglycan/LPS O-acetylase OafA/YrhL
MLGGRRQLRALERFFSQSGACYRSIAVEIRQGALSTLIPVRQRYPGTSDPARPAQGREAQSDKRQELPWLNALKGIAILAVVLDHAFLVDNYLLWKHLYFSVSWFIFLAGVSNTYSTLSRGFRLADALALWRRRLATILPAYLCASALAFLFLDLGRQNLGASLHDFLLFHSLPPLYFIALLLQLLLAFPLLFLLWFRWGWPGKIVLAAALPVVAAVLAQRITFPWVLGAHYLLGASFLYLFALGMVLTPVLVSRRPRPLIWLCASLPLFVFAEYKNVLTGGLLMTHPPSNLLCLYSLGLIGCAYALCTWLPSSRLVQSLAWLGQRSLEIFVFHYLFLAPFLTLRHVQWTARLSLEWNQLALMVAAVPFAIAGSLLTRRVTVRLTSAIRTRVSSFSGPAMIAAPQAGDELRKRLLRRAA